MLRHTLARSGTVLPFDTAAIRPCRSALYGALLICILATLAGCTRQEVAVDMFEDVTAGSGLENYAGMTYGATWGDFDGDGLPDLYLTNHLAPATLYRNVGAGRFEDVTAKYFAPEDIVADKHGSAWADYDNDGRLDLVQLTGAVKALAQNRSFCSTTTATVWSTWPTPSAW